MIIFADYIKLFKIVNIKTARKRVAEDSGDLNWLDNKLAGEIIDRDEITHYYAEKVCFLKKSVQCQAVVQNVRCWEERNGEKIRQCHCMNPWGTSVSNTSCNSNCSIGEKDVQKLEKICESRNGVIRGLPWILNDEKLYWLGHFMKEMTAGQVPYGKVRRRWFCIA